MGIIMGIALGIAGLIIGGLALGITVYLFIEINAMKKSTHSIQYVPVEAPINDEQMTKQFTKAGLSSDPFDSQPDEVIL